MHRYLPGILLLQVVTVALGWGSFSLGGAGWWWQWLLSAGLLALVTALWFASIERARGRAAVDALRLHHAKEREKLKVTVERDKARVQEDASRQIRREGRRGARRANLKVALAFGVTTLAGVLLLITELFTLGFMTITTAVGAMGGYLVRWRQSRSADLATAARPDVALDASLAPRLAPQLASPPTSDSDVPAGGSPGSLADQPSESSGGSR